MLSVELKQGHFLCTIKAVSCTILWILDKLVDFVASFKETRSESMLLFCSENVRVDFHHFRVSSTSAILLCHFILVPRAPPELRPPRGGALREDPKNGCVGD